MTDQNDEVAAEMSDEDRKQFEELMAKADDVISEDGSISDTKEEPSLVFDNADGLEFIPNPAIGDGINPEELEAAGITPEMIKRFMKARQIMSREKQPCKKYVKRTVRAKARKASRKARKANRG